MVVLFIATSRPEGDKNSSCALPGYDSFFFMKIPLKHWFLQQAPEYEERSHDNFIEMCQSVFIDCFDQSKTNKNALLFL